MRRSLFLFCAALACSMLGACTAPILPPPESRPAEASSGDFSSESAAVYHQLTPAQAKQRIDENPDLLLLDVRRLDEYTVSHLPGARLLPNEVIEQLASSQLPDLDAEILLYCRSGNRSRQAADKLVALGYTRVYDFGGIQSWPYETVSGEPEADPPLPPAAASDLPPVNPGCTDETCSV